MLMLELAVNVIVVQVAPGANTLRSPDLAGHVDLYFQKKKRRFIHFQILGVIHFRGSKFPRPSGP